ncbi:MAG: hypothetical protein ACO2Z9_08830 [Crocinitomicaceae bacterium]
MRQFLIMALVLLSFSSFGQSENTFYIKKKADSDVKKVLSKGDRLSITYTKSDNQKERLKGKLKSIDEESIQIEDQKIQVSQIVKVQLHNVSRKLGGAVIAGAGVGIALRNQKAFANSTDLSGISYGIGVLIGGVTALSSTIFLIVIPKKYDMEKFEFRTHIVE